MIPDKLVVTHLQLIEAIGCFSAALSNFIEARIMDKKIRKVEQTSAKEVKQVKAPAKTAKKRVKVVAKAKKVVKKEKK